MRTLETGTDDAPLGAVRAGIETPWTTPRLSRWHFIAFVQLSEGVVIVSSPWLRLKGVAQNAPFAGTESPAMLGVTIALALVLHCILRALGGYRFDVIIHLRRSSAVGGAAWLLATGPLAVWMTKVELGAASWQVWLPLWLAGGAGILLVRTCAACGGGMLLRAGWLGHAVCIVGNGPEAQTCAACLRCNDAGITLIDTLASPSNADSAAGRQPALHAVTELQRVMQSRRVDEVIVATATRNGAEISDLIHHLRYLPVRVLLWPPSVGVHPEWITTGATAIGEVPLLPAGNPPLEGWRWVLKDMQDRTLALLLLLFCLPILLAIAAAVWISSPGPVLFMQEREGYSGRKFRIFKFRTMHAATSASYDQLVLTARRDPRVFRLGAILRRTSLDELPQLFNVLLGDMWLVGPRPHSPLATAAGQRYPEAVRQYLSRFRVKPGITGWAQVNGWRGTTSTVEQIEQRVAHDLYYIEHWSVWFDMRILWQTLLWGFTGQNAY